MENIKVKHRQAKKNYQLDLTEYLERSFERRWELYMEEGRRHMDIEFAARYSLNEKLVLRRRWFRRGFRHAVQMFKD